MQMTGKEENGAADAGQIGVKNMPINQEPSLPAVHAHSGQGDAGMAESEHHNMPSLSEPVVSDEMAERVRKDRELDEKLARQRQQRKEESEKPVARPKMFGSLKPEEEALLKLSQEGKIDEIKQLLKEHKKIKIDCLDDSGTTPLEHACYKGNKELVELLLSRGADVNNNMQTQGYTPLMFAALAGKQEIVRILLRHGAKTGATNNIGRTASQLAGFVGNHAVAVTISNFFTVEDLDYYTVPNGLEKEAKLPAKLAPIVHRFIMHNVLHPVKLLYFLRDNPVILDEKGHILRTFDSIVEKQIKSREMNEIMAMKVHYLACVLRYVEKMSDQGKSIDDMVKLFVRGRDARGFQDYMDKFVRESIRSFPYYQTPLHTTMVHAIAKANLGGNSGSISILEQSINGQHMAGRDGAPCETCADAEAKKKCSACHMVNYCDDACQKMHWPVHKKECPQLKVQYEIMEKRKAEEEERTRREEEEMRKKEEEANDQRHLEQEPMDEPANGNNAEEVPNSVEEPPQPLMPDSSGSQGDSTVAVEDVKLQLRQDDKQPFKANQETEALLSPSDTVVDASSSTSKAKGKNKGGKKKKKSPLSTS